MNRFILLLGLLFTFTLSAVEINHITQPIVFNKSNQIVDGNFQVLRVVDYTSIPAIIIGDADNVEPKFRVNNVTLKNFVIYGNRQFQNLELWKNDIRNNGITIRGASNVTIDNCFLYQCRSGGIVIEKNCFNITIVNCIAADNQFDGIAGYFSTKLKIKDCYLLHNLGAGFSFDLQMNYVNISNCEVNHNGIGIFVRDSNDYVISNTQFNNTLFDLYFNRVNNNELTKPNRVLLESVKTTTQNILNIVNGGF
jgi:parallel beta-helix repeat protein